MTGNEPRKPKITVARRTRTASVHQEAKLLMNFMATSPDEPLDNLLLNKPLITVKQPKTPESRPSIISPSFSFEAKRFDHHDQDCEEVGTKQRQAENQQCQSSSGLTFFDVHCPSLSLRNDASVSVNAPTESSPAYLFSRPIISEPVDMDTMDMHKVADTIGSNLVQSFNIAMTWRTKTWIKGLSEKLSARYQVERGRAVRNAVYNRSATGVNDTVDVIKDAIKKSNEARVIHSLSKASSTIVVHDVRTTFFILEQQLHHQEHENGMPPPKRRRHVSRESMDSNETGEPYYLSHAITLDAKCSVSTSPMKKTTVSFRAPGAIHGTFVRDCAGNVSLKNISISLDTEALALSIEENSRRIVRAASEEWMVSPPINYCTIYDTVQSQNASCDASDSTPVPKPEENLDSQRYYSDRRYESYFYSPTTKPDNPEAIVTPKVQNSAYEATYQPTSNMPLALRALPIEDERHGLVRGRFLNPRRVSPTELTHQHATFVTPTPSKITLMEDPIIIASNFPVPPSLVSPYIQNGEEVADDSDAPSMPALLEVARAAHARCH